MTTHGPALRRTTGVVATVVAVAAARLALAAAGGGWADAGLVVDVLAALTTATVASSLARFPRDRRSRWAWWYLTAFPLAWCVAPLGWLTGLPTAVADAGRLTAVALVTASWWCAARAGGTLSRVRLGIDGALGGAAVLAVAWTPVLESAWEGVGRGPSGVAAVALPVAMTGSAVLGLGIIATEMTRGGRLRSALFVVAMLVFAASDVAWASGGVPAWAVGWTLYALTIRIRLAPTPRVALVPTGGRLVYLPYLFIGPTAAALAVEYARGSLEGPQAAAGLAIVALLVARQHVVVLENGQLVDRLRETERRLRHLATHDSLTGLPGRALLHEILAAVAERQPVQSRPVALAFVDVDYFKDVNDRYGHAAGDAVLVEVAQRLRRSLALLSGEAFAARLGGDEFAVLVVGDAAAAGDPAALAALITSTVGGPVAVGTTPVQVSVSVGVAVAAPDRICPSDLLHAADQQMYAVKHARTTPRP